MILYVLGSIIRLVFRVVSIRFGYALAYVISYIGYLVWPRGRKCIRENLRHVVGNNASKKEIDRLAKGALRNYCKYLLDFVCLPATKPEEIMKRVAFQGWENLGKALEEGKGCILVGLHQGNWELTVAAVVLNKYPLNVIVESFDSAKLDEFVQSRRRRLGMNVVAIEKGIGGMVEALRRNEHLVLLIDSPNAGKGVEVRFGDAVTRMPRGAATLALKTGAKIVPMASVRRPDNTFLTSFGECISFEPSGTLSKDIRELTQTVMNSLEPYIKQYPDQYYMFRCMWPKATRDNCSKQP